MTVPSAVTSPPCWVCSSDRTSAWRERTAPVVLRSEDFQITDHRYGTTLELSRCAECGFIFAGSAPELARIGELYRDLDDPEYLRTSAARRRQMHWILRTLLHEQPRAHTLLDVGAGSGLLVAAAVRSGLDAIGVEPSVHLASSAREREGVRVLTGTLPHPELEGARFDLVTLIDVVEHVAEPVRLLRSAAARLADGGLLAVITPDVGSVAARVLGRRWWHFRPAHIGYFSAWSLERAGREAGLQLVRRKRPRWWLPIGYLAARIAVYLPRSVRIRFGTPSRPLRRLGDIAMPLDLRDSLLYFFRRRPHP